MKLILFCLLLINISHSKILNIKNETSLNDFNLEFFNDKNSIYTIENIDQANFQKKRNKNSLKRNRRNNLWFKLHIKNITNKEKDLFLNYAQTHYIVKLKVYIKRNNQIKEINSYIRNNKKEEKNLIGNSLLTTITLSKNEELTLYINAKTHSHMFYDIRLNDIKNHSYYASNSFIYLIFLLGLILAQAIYYLFLFALTPYKEYIYFSLVLFSVAIWSFYVYGGIAEFFHIYGNTGLPFNSMFYLFPIFTILFFKAIFIKGSEFKKINIALNIFVIVLAIMPIQYLLSLMGLVDDFFIRSFMEESYFLQLIIFSFFVVYIYLKKVPLSVFFLLGHIINIFFFIITVLFFAGLIPLNNLTIYSNLIGAVIESIFFSILLFHKIKNLHKVANANKNKLHLQDNKLAAMREVIENISHQWRQPLSQINSSVLIIDDELYSKNIHNKNIDEKLSEIESMTKYMSQTIDDFKNFYAKRKSKSIFLVNKTIDNAISLIHESLIYHNIKLNIKLGRNISIFGLKNELQQSILIILNNAKEALLSNEIDSPKINLSLEENEEKVFLIIYDNAGGIKEELLNKIFEAYFTTKMSSKGSGLGLYLAKTIIETNMHGKLEATNYKDGAKFTISLNKLILK